jgi:hypothetical protein
MPEEKPPKSGPIKKLWNAWKRLFDLVFGEEYIQTAIWAGWWAVAAILSAHCSFVNIFPHRPWLEFLPSWVIGEVALIALFLGAPFPIRLSVWKLSLFPAICVWLPYFIRLFFGSPDSHPFSKFFDRFGLKLVPHLVPPDVGDPQSGAIKMAGVCLGCTLAVLATAAFLALWCSIKRDRTRKAIRSAVVGSRVEHG